MFRSRIKYTSYPCSPVFNNETKELESGEIIDVQTDATEEVMPDVDLFDLKNQINAGVIQDEVNSKVMKRGVSLDGLSKAVSKGIKVKNSNDEVIEID